MEELIQGFKENWKRYLISSAETFIATFLLFAVPTLLSPDFEWEQSAVIGVLVVATRMGVKAIWEILNPSLFNWVKK